jgi:hypothetical protein
MHVFILAVLPFKKKSHAFPAWLCVLVSAGNSPSRQEQITPLSSRRLVVLQESGLVERLVLMAGIGRAVRLLAGREEGHYKDEQKKFW